MGGRLLLRCRINGSRDAFKITLTETLWSIRVDTGAAEPEPESEGLEEEGSMDSNAMRGTGDAQMTMNRRSRVLDEAGHAAKGSKL